MSARGKLTSEETALAFLMGFGMLLMMMALIGGAALGAQANQVVFGTLFMLGAAAFAIGALLWLGYVQPWKQFDDINVPVDTGHQPEGH